jgi:hypothetical protein
MKRWMNAEQKSDQEKRQELLAAACVIPHNSQEL